MRNLTRASLLCIRFTINARSYGIGHDNDVHEGPSENAVGFKVPVDRGQVAEGGVNRWIQL